MELELSLVSQHVFRKRLVWELPYGLFYSLFWFSPSRIPGLKDALEAVKFVAAFFLPYLKMSIIPGFWGCLP